MADVSQIKLPDGNTYDIKDNGASTATNWVNGSATNSVRTTGSASEDSGYTIGIGAVAEGYGTQARGNYSHAEGQGSIAKGENSHAEGLGTTANGSGTHAEGLGTTASSGSHAEGASTTASGQYSHAEGAGTEARSDYSHAEGASTLASGSVSHAEGSSTTASGSVSHAEGQNTTASNQGSHAEGLGTTASGIASHAEGESTTASGLASHAEGSYTIANHMAQHVFGVYNIADSSAAASTVPGNYIEIVGNGANNARSNARTLDWSGNEVLAGKLTVGVAGTNSMDVATVGQIPTVPSDIVNTITTTAGAHTVITNATGAVSFNVPTTAAHVSAVPLSASSTTISSDALCIQNNQSSKTSQAGSNPYVTTVMLGDGRQCTIDEYGDGYLAIHGAYGIFLHPRSDDIKIYNATNTYAVGDIVWYDRKYYRCTTAISTAEAWTSGHWSDISATSGIVKVMGGIHPAVSEVYNLGSSDLKWKVLYAKFINGITQINDVQIPSLTAQTTQAIYPIAINAIGQITGYGTALTSKVEISGGTDVSLVTQGEKYTWNHKQNALTNPVTGTGTSGYLAKFNGTSSITSGPQLGSGTTTYLRNDGSWATPAYPVTSVNTKTGAVSLTASDIGIKFGYTTSGNNRAVLQDSNGNLYVTQKDDNSNTFKSFYGTCDTVAATAEKVITLSVTTGWQLVAGTVVGVKFTNTNTAQNPTLNINSTGAKSIYVNNAIITTGNLWYAGEAGRVHFYMYDGTYWVFMGHSYDWNSDTKVTLTALTPPASGTSYFPTFHTATSGTTGLNATSNYYLKIMNGTTSANGYVYICAGNSTASGTAGNMIGGITLYGTGSYYTDIKSGSPTANRVITLPDKSGTVALTSNLSEYLPLTGGNVTGPVNFGDSVSIDEATLGDLVVNGNVSFVNARSITHKLVDSLDLFTSVPVDGDTYLASYADGLNTSHTGTNTYGRRPIAKLWEYIKNKLNSSLTANKLVYANSSTQLTSIPNIAYFTGNSTATTPATYYRLHIHGATYGNTAANMISDTVGLFSFGDGGPQITFDTSATPGGGQAGAIIFTDNDNAGTGVSWHFVSNQTDWNVTSKRFHARTGISIGTNLPNTTYNLYVNGTTYFNGNVNGGPYHKITTSTSAPSGGSNGDIWFVYA